MYRDESEMFVSGSMGGRPLYSWWDQRQAIYRMEHDKSFEDMSFGAQEIMWAAIIHYQAFDIADWMISKGYNTDESYRWGYESDSDSCVPYDASEWDDWIESKLWIPPNSVSKDLERRANLLPYKSSKKKVCRKETIKEMVKRKYIKIPLNSGIPLYYWLLEGYKLEDGFRQYNDFCHLYTCMECVGDWEKGGDTKTWMVEQMEVCILKYFDHTLRAGSTLRLITMCFVCNIDNAWDYLHKYLAIKTERMYIRYRDRKTSSSAIRIQCLFRVYMSKKRMNVLRSHPDNLFSIGYMESRKRKLHIDDSKFGK